MHGAGTTHIKVNKLAVKINYGSEVETVALVMASPIARWIEVFVWSVNLNLRAIHRSKAATKPLCQEHLKLLIKRLPLWHSNDILLLQSAQHSAEFCANLLGCGLSNAKLECQPLIRCPMCQSAEERSVKLV